MSGHSGKVIKAAPTVSAVPASVPAPPTNAPRHPATALPSVPDTAADEAVRAAAHARVTVEEVVEMAGLNEIEQLFRAVWETDRDRPPISADVLRALAHSGSYVAAARDADGRLAGAGVGFLATDPAAPGAEGQPPVASLHSHIAAVAPGSQRRGIGSALKLHQRAWATGRNLRSITWTFDPLVRRNAGFNAHLGAEFVRYYQDFYGEMSDRRNAGHGSDRLLARWDLDAPATPRVAVEPNGEESLLLATDPAGGPFETEVDPAELGDRVWVNTPADIESIRQIDPALAARWRAAVRNAIGPLLPAWRIDGFTTGGAYLLVRDR